MTEQLEPGIDPADSTRTRILRSEMGDNWRAWRWLRQQFSKVSLGVIVTISVAWCTTHSNLKQAHDLEVGSLKTRVSVLETQIVPDLKLAERVTTLEKQGVDHQARIEDLESNYSFARAHAGDPPTTRRRAPK